MSHDGRTGRMGSPLVHPHSRTLGEHAVVSPGVALITLVLGVSLARDHRSIRLPRSPHMGMGSCAASAMPTYVLAYVYAHPLGMGGPAEQWWQLSSALRRACHRPKVSRVTMIMALDTFPVICWYAAHFKISMSRLKKSRACGVLPGLRFGGSLLIRPAIAALVALVILYVISDFGAVSLPGIKP